MPTARDRIVDAAAQVLTERGIVGATTREIARAAGCSEALLYKHFADKQEIFLAVLTRQPLIELTQVEASADLADALATMVQRLLEFFTRTFPMAVSIFGAPGLLAEHREAITARGFGPEGTVTAVEQALADLQRAGQVRADADVEAAARVIVGVAFHRAFLAAYAGDPAVADARAFAEREAALLAPVLGTSGSQRTGAAVTG